MRIMAINQGNYNQKTNKQTFGMTPERIGSTLNELSGLAQKAQRFDLVGGINEMATDIVKLFESEGKMQEFVYGFSANKPTEQLTEMERLARESGRA